ncbi:uncharacterized protein LOC132707851 [Cylas formicarius]|uniref:uncharacterized protein LOC132707851 n=1 Tax=Cylas formicarius TaxID=197179 RepID=UPI002958ACB4|nr:uncharacterized protein LOC132707851 [Cylas formicarius]XP_060535802.1 uncharacterized protein LOC132707851 [Cylas formicarius]
MSATMDNNNRNEKSEGIAAATDDGRDENGCARNSAAILESPSLAHALVTTVPQNITARALGDKHTPTRNSLRHSRMIVMNRNGKTPRHYLPFVIRHYKIVKSMKVMTILLAVAMCLISVWLVLWTPTMSAADYPYWSAVPALCSGIVGCLFLGCCPRPYPGRRLSWTYHYVKFLSVSTTVISIASIVLVLTFALIHVTYLYSSTCESFDKLNKTCVCAPGGATSAVFNDVYHYEDLTCDEVEQFLRDLEISTCAVNFVMLVLEISYLYVHWTDRDLAGFSRVPARDPVKSDGS